MFTLFTGRHVGGLKRSSNMAAPYYALTLWHSVILCGTFWRISQLWNNAHSLNLENCLLYLSSTISQFCPLHSFWFYFLLVWRAVSWNVPRQNCNMSRNATEVVGDSPSNKKNCKKKKRISKNFELEKTLKPQSTGFQLAPNTDHSRKYGLHSYANWPSNLIKFNRNLTSEPHSANCSCITS